MSLSEQVNIGARITAAVSVATAITQSTAAAATTQDGQAVDRNALGRRYYSAKAIVAAVFIGNSTAQSASLGINVQHSSDGTSWDNYSTATVPAVTSFPASTNSTAGTLFGTVEQSVNLIGARRYVRIQIPPPTVSSSSSGNSFTAVTGAFVFGGADELPAV